MDYERPELILKGRGIDAVRSLEKGFLDPDAGLLWSTTPAYEADG